MYSSGFLFGINVLLLRKETFQAISWCAILVIKCIIIGPCMMYTTYSYHGLFPNPCNKSRISCKCLHSHVVMSYVSDIGDGVSRLYFTVCHIYNKTLLVPKVKMTLYTVQWLSLNKKLYKSIWYLWIWFTWPHLLRGHSEWKNNLQVWISVYKQHLPVLGHGFLLVCWSWFEAVT